MSDTPSLSRRDFLQGAVATCGVLGACAPVPGYQHPAAPPKALDDPQVIHDKIRLQGGRGPIDGYLARPRGTAAYPAVVVIAGNSVAEEYIRNTTALLAQGGFVGLAPDIFALQTEGMTEEERRRVFETEITDDAIFRDLKGGMAYLQAQPFVRPGPMGVSGFCFGGRTALLLAARERAIGAVVSFYGNLSRPPGSTRLTPLEALERLAVPVQGHYAKEDPLIPLSDVTQLETALRRRHVPVEMHTYEASHGFFAYTRPVYNARAAEAAGRRMITWFRRYLG